MPGQSDGFKKTRPPPNFQAHGHGSSPQPAPAELLAPPFREMFLLVLPSLFCNIHCTFCRPERFDHELHLGDDILYEKLTPVYPETRCLILKGGDHSRLRRILSLEVTRIWREASSVLA